MLGTAKGKHVGYVTFAYLFSTAETVAGVSSVHQRYYSQP